MDQLPAQKKTIAFFTPVLIAGGLDRQILSLADLFIEHGYMVHIYSLTPVLMDRTLVKQSGNLIIHSPDNSQNTLMITSLLKNSPAILRIFFGHGPNLSAIRTGLRNILEINIRERCLLEKNFQNLFRQFKEDHLCNPFAFVVGFSFQTIHYLHVIKSDLGINVKYIEISSPRWRFRTRSAESYEIQSIENIDDIIVPSKTIGEELIECYRTNHSYSVLPLFLQMPVITNPMISSNPPHTFGMAARLSPEKNQDLLIRVMAIIKKRYPDKSIRLVIAGTGPTEKKLHALVKELDLKDEVSFLGQVNAMEDFIDHFGVVVSLSDVESVSATLLESIYSGKPLIATDVGANRDLLKDGFNGYIIPDKWDLDGIAQKIVSILMDKEKYAIMAKNSRSIYDSAYGDTKDKLKQFFAL